MPWKNEHDMVLQILNTIFFDSKTFAKLDIVLYFVINIQDWFQNLNRHFQE